jgi:hypothetical protein
MLSMGLLPAAPFRIAVAMQSLRRTNLTFSALLLASGVSAACERMSAPPCPRRALALDRRGTLADQATAARYFPSLATHKVYDGREGVGELLLFGERPLSDLAVKGAYRVIETGPLGHVGVLEHRTSETVARWKRWSLCDDHNEFGAALERGEPTTDRRAAARLGRRHTVTAAIAASCRSAAVEKGGRIDSEQLAKPLGQVYCSLVQVV